MQAELKSHVLKFWRLGQMAKNEAKMWVFCNGHNKLAFLVTGQIGMNFGQKTSITAFYSTFVVEF